MQRTQFREENADVSISDIAGDGSTGSRLPNTAGRLPAVVSQPVNAGHPGEPPPRPDPQTNH